MKDFWENAYRQCAEVLHAHHTHTSGMQFMQDLFSKTSESYTDILSEYKGIITLN